ncbi:MAG: hypothetical protein AAGH78_11755 [Cyanobacteria bacterium P01_H01_bin.58]
MVQPPGTLPPNFGDGAVTRSVRTRRQTIGLGAEHRKDARYPDLNGQSYRCR